MRLYIARNRDHRRAFFARIHQSVIEMSDARPRGAADHNRIPRQIRLGYRRKDAILLVPNVDKLDFPVAAKSIDHRIQRVPDNPVAPAHAGFLQHLPQKVRDTLSHSATLSNSITGVFLKPKKPIRYSERRLMSRTFLIAALLAIVTLPAGLRAQDDVEEAWRTLFMRALYEAGANNFAKAEGTFQQALKEAERFGPNDARVGTTVNSLGLVYRSEHKFSEAEAAYRRSLAILSKAYGDDSMDVANVNFNIATVLFDEGKAPAAMPFLQATLGVYEGMLGNASLKTASVMCMMGDVYRLTKDFKSAEPQLRQCADIREREGGMTNAELADALHSLALVYQSEGKYALAEPRFTLAEKIREKTLGITSPQLAQTMEDHAALLKQMGRDKEAERLTNMAAAIRRTEKTEKKTK